MSAAGAPGAAAGTASAAAGAATGAGGAWGAGRHCPAAGGTARLLQAAQSTVMRPMVVLGARQPAMVAVQCPAAAAAAATSRRRR